jgi:hypothetical protein
MVLVHREARLDDNNLIVALRVNEGENDAVDSAIGSGGHEDLSHRIDGSFELRAVGCRNVLNKFGNAHHARVLVVTFLYRGEHGLLEKLGWLVAGRALSKG